MAIIVGTEGWEGELEALLDAGGNELAPEAWDRLREAAIGPQLNPEVDPDVELDALEAASDAVDLAEETFNAQAEDAARQLEDLRVEAAADKTLTDDEASDLDAKLLLAVEVLLGRKTEAELDAIMASDNPLGAMLGGHAGEMEGPELPDVDPIDYDALPGAAEMNQWDILVCRQMKVIGDARSVLGIERSMKHFLEKHKRPETMPGVRDMGLEPAREVAQALLSKI